MVTRLHPAAAPALPQQLSQQTTPKEGFPQPPRLGESSRHRESDGNPGFHIWMRRGFHGDLMGCNGIQWDLTYEFTLWLLNIANVNIGLYKDFRSSVQGFYSDVLG